MSKINKITPQINKACIRLTNTCLLFCFVLLIALSGCKKFLEMPLKDKVPQEALFSDEQGFMDALTGVYLGMDKPGAVSMKGLYTHDLSIGMLSVMVNNYTNASSSVLGDNLFANVYKYDYNQVGVKQEIGYIWNGMYNNIANLNNLLGYIDAKKDIFSRDHYYKVKGEALALRALFHFDLARLFGQSPATGLNEKAIPYITSFTANSIPFVSLTAALDSCIVDLNKAKAVLSQADTLAINQGSADLFSGYSQNHMN
jgi:hypothetical protein